MPRLIGNTTFSTGSNNVTLFVDGVKTRVGIQTENPKASLDVAGLIQTEGLIVRKDSVKGKLDSASLYGFNPRFDDWSNGAGPADGWEAVGSNFSKTEDSYGFAVAFVVENGTDYWHRTVVPNEPLYKNTFLTGTYSYKLDSYTAGWTPGLSVTLNYRDADNNDLTGNKTFIIPIGTTSTGAWYNVRWNATAPTNQEITSITIGLNASRSISGTNGVVPTAESTGGTGNELKVGIGTIKFDNLSFNFLHENMKLGNDGSPIGAYIDEGTIGNLQISNVIHSSSWTTSPSPQGWYIDKNGRIHATAITIYDGAGNVMMRGGSGASGGEDPGPDNDPTGGAFPGVVLPDVATHHPGLGFKINHSQFSVAEDQYIYIHGFDITGQPANANGTINGPLGVTQNVVPTAVDARFDNRSGWILWKRGTTGTADDLKFAFNTFDAGWTYVSAPQTLSTLSNPELYGAIGEATTDEDEVLSAAVWDHVIPTQFIEAILDPASETEGTDITTEGEEIFANWNFNISKFTSSGRDVPHGLEAFRYSGTPPHNVFGYVDNDKATQQLKISNTTFGTIGEASFGVMIPAFPVKDSESIYKITYSAKVSAGSATSSILNVHEYNAELTDSQLYIAQPSAEASDKQASSVYGTSIKTDEAKALTTSYQQFSYDYAPTSGTSYASVGFHHGSTLSPDQDLDIEYIRIREIADPSWIRDHDAFSVIAQGHTSFAEGRADRSTVPPFTTYDASGPDTNVSGVYKEGASSSAGRLAGAAGANTYNVLVWDQVNGGFRTGTSVMPNANAISELTEYPGAYQYTYDTRTESGHGDSSAWWLATGLNNLGSNSFVFIYTLGDPRDNRYGPDNILLTAMKRCGASNTVFGAGVTDDAAIGIQENSSYILIGTPGINEGGGAECYSGGIDNDPSAWCRVDVNIIANTILQVAGSSVGSLTLEEDLAAMQQNVNEAIRLAADASLHEVSIFTNVQDGPPAHIVGDGNFFTGSVRNKYTDEFEFGDVWISANTETRLPDGTLSTQAINRWQNSTGGFANTNDYTTSLGWRSSTDDAFGNIYLSAYKAQNVADLATLLYWDNQYVDSGVVYGPNVATSQEGTANPNPWGDLWINTGNNNATYLYLTNSSFATSGWEHGEDNAGIWAQTVYYTSFIKGPVNGTKTGWYSGRDLTILVANDMAHAAQTIAWNANQLADTAQTIAWNANQIAWESSNAAALAQFAADREVLTFFSDDEPTTHRGNGDIWIDTNRSPANNWIISRWQNTGTDGTGVWLNANQYNDPTGTNMSADFTPGAIGQFYLQNFLTAKSGTRNLIPSPYSQFASPEEDYAIYVSGSFPDASRPFPIAHSSLLSVVIDKTVESPAGGNALKISKNGSLSTFDYFAFANSSSSDLETAAGGASAKYDTYGIDVTPGSKFIFSFYIKSTRTNTPVQSQVRSSLFGSNTAIIDGSVSAAAGEEYIGYFDGGSASISTDQQDVGADWTRVEWVYDFTGTDSTHPHFETGLVPNTVSTIIPKIGVNWDNDAGDYWISGVQLETVDPNSLNPKASDYIAADESGGIAALRGLTDGKALTRFDSQYTEAAHAGSFFGPHPQFTPEGERNPAPHGDMWVNTSNNNVLYRYHANQEGIFQGTGTANLTNYLFYWNPDVLNLGYNVQPSTQWNGPAATGAGISPDLFPTNAKGKSGWYEIKDYSIISVNNYINAVNTVAEFANSAAFKAHQLASNAQFASDREILGFFKPHDTVTSTFTPTGNGDVWIQTDKVIDSDGSINTNAIFIANTFTGGDGIDAQATVKVAAVDTALFWHKAPTSAIGLMYLQSYGATSGKVVTFFGDPATATTYPVGSNWRGYGPLPQETPSGQANPYPDGDLWINTEDGANNNQLFRYYQNTDGIYQGTGIANLAPYVFRYPDNVPASSNPKSGWYELRDRAIYTANDTAILANLVAWDANTAAYIANGQAILANTVAWHANVAAYFANGQAILANNVAWFANTKAFQVLDHSIQSMLYANNARIAADRDILAFIQPGIPSPAGNGDIWIDTDRYLDYGDVAANSWSISRWQNTSVTDPPGPDGFWANPNGYEWATGESGYATDDSISLGKIYLQTYLEATTRSKNYIPRAYSLFNEPEYDYKRSGASGEYLEPYPITYSTSGVDSLDIVDTDGHIGEKSLKFVGANFPSDRFQVLFANTQSTRDGTLPTADPDAATFIKYGIKIPKGRKWIYSAYVKADEAYSDASFRFSWYVSNGNPTFAGPTTAWEQSISSDVDLDEGVFATQVGVFTRHSTVIDLTTGDPTSNATYIIPGFQVKRGAIHANPSPTVYFDAFQLEEVSVDSDNPQPTAYMPADESGVISFARGLTDSKIVTQFTDSFLSATTGRYHGPDPHYDEHGIVNPDPHADFWVDTANGFVSYRYHSNLSVSWAGTGAANLTAYVNNYNQTYIDVVGPGADGRGLAPLGDEGFESGWYEYTPLKLHTVIDDLTANSEALAANSAALAANAASLAANAGRLETAQSHVESITTSLTTAEGQLRGDESSGLLNQINSLGSLEDREIIAFIQPTDPIINNDGPANGDIWIDTDRYLDYGDAVANSWSVSRWQNTHATSAAGFWANPNNYMWNGTAGDGYAPIGAFGKFYLTNYLAALSSNKNYMPRGYSLFDSRLDDYSIVGATTHAAAEAIYRPFPITFDSAILDGTSIDTTIESPVGGNVLKIEAGSSGDGRGEIGFANTINPVQSDAVVRSRFSAYGISIPTNSKWILSCHIKCTTDNGTIRSTIFGSNNAIINGDMSGVYHGGFVEGSERGTDHTTEKKYTFGGGAGELSINEWHRVSWVYNFTDEIDTFTSETGIHANTFTKIIPRFSVHGVDNTRDYHIAGLQLEQTLDNLEPSTFSTPDEGPGINWQRGLSDRKMIVFANIPHEGGMKNDFLTSNPTGPDPTIDMDGIPNPAPDGDRWLNTDLNLEFVYQANSSNKTSNAIFMFANSSPSAQSGWYSQGTIENPVPPDNDHLRGHWKFDGAFNEGTGIRNLVAQSIANTFHDYAGDMGPALLITDDHPVLKYEDVVTSLHCNNDSIVGKSFLSNNHFVSGVHASGTIIDVIDATNPYWKDAQQRTLAAWFKPVAANTSQQFRIWNLGQAWAEGMLGNAMRVDNTNDPNSIWVEYSSDDTYANGHYANVMLSTPFSSAQGYTNERHITDKSSFTGTGAIKQNTWNFVAATFEFASNVGLTGVPRSEGKIKLFVYNVDDGLVFANTNILIDGDFDYQDPTTWLHSTQANVTLAGAASGSGTAQELVSYWDEVRYYDKSLTVPEIQGLFVGHTLEPTVEVDGLVYPDGRPVDFMEPHQPGADSTLSVFLSVKKGFSNFTTSGAADYAYFHGHDDSGTDADVNGYIYATDPATDERRVIEARKGAIRISQQDQFHDDGYILYQANGDSVGATSRYYVFAQPVIQQPDTGFKWRFDDGGGNWEYFTPSDDDFIVVGDARACTAASFGPIDVWPLSTQFPSKIRQQSNHIIAGEFEAGSGTSRNIMRNLPDSAMYLHDPDNAFGSGAIGALKDGSNRLQATYTSLGDPGGPYAMWGAGTTYYIEIQANSNPNFSSDSIWVDSIRTYWPQLDGSNNMVFPYAIAVKSSFPGSNWSNVAGAFADLTVDNPVVSEWANSRSKILASANIDFSTSGFFPNTMQMDASSGPGAIFPEGIRLPTTDGIGQFVNRVRVYASTAYHQAPWDYESKLWYQQTHNQGSDYLYNPKLHEIELWQGTAPDDDYASLAGIRPDVQNEEVFFDPTGIEVTTDSVLDALLGSGRTSEIADLIQDEKITDFWIRELSGSKIVAQSIKADALAAGAIATGHLEVLGGESII